MGRYLVVLSVALLAGCAHTRDPQAVLLCRPGDEAMSCEQIGVEYRSNTEVAAAKIKKNNDDDVQDVVVGALIWPGLADFKNADGIEGNALLDRNIRLRQMAIERGCDVSSYPEQPKRYD